MKRRILFANELGSGLTHFGALRQTFERLRADADVEAQFFVALAEEARATGFDAAPIALAPSVVDKRPNKQNAALTFGSFMFNELIRRQRDAAASFEAWDNVLRVFDPHLVVCDFAPMAQMVAFGRWPVVAIGYGYTLPPQGMARFPFFGSGRPPTARDEQEQADQFNAMLRPLGATLLEKLPDLCRADAHINATVPPFDPYIEQRGATAYAGIHLPNGSPWPKAEADGGLAYFHAYSQGDVGIREGLKNSGLAFECYAGVPTAAFKAGFADSRIRVHDTPLDLKALLPGRKVMVHMGGQGVALAALFAGVPQVLLTTHQENSFNARMISAEGAGVYHAMATANGRKIANLIADVAKDPAMRRGAFEMGRKLAQYRDADPIGEVVKAAKTFLA